MRLQEGVEAIAVIWSKPFSLLLSICVCVCDRLCNLVYVCYGAYLNTIQSTNPLLEIWNALGLRSKEKKQTPVQVKHMPMCVCVCVRVITVIMRWLIIIGDMLWFLFLSPASSST